MDLIIFVHVHIHVHFRENTCAYLPDRLAELPTYLPTNRQVGRHAGTCLHNYVHAAYETDLPAFLPANLQTYTRPSFLSKSTCLYVCPCGTGSEIFMSSCTYTKEASQEYSAGENLHVKRYHGKHNRAYEHMDW